MTSGRLKILKVYQESEHADSSPLNSDISGEEVRAWWTENGVRNILNNEKRTIGFWEHHDVLLSASHRGGMLVAGRNLLVPDNGLSGTPRVYVPNTDVGGILDQVGSTCVAHLRILPGSIPSGIFAGSKAPGNWFHWLIDMISTLYFSRFLPSVYDDYPLLVPLGFADRETWGEALALVSAGREVIEVDPHQWNRVENLVRLEPITRSGLRSVLGPQQARISVVKEPLLHFRDFVLAEYQLHKSASFTGRKVFLCGGENTVRQYNQAEILELAVARGFEPVFLENVSLRESIQIFREAETIVGPHGAGWATLLFARPQTKTLLWSWPDESEDNYYENLAYVSGVKYHRIFTDPPQGTILKQKRRPEVENYYLDPAKFLAALEKLDKA